MDFIKEIFRFFTDKNYSVTSKFVGIVISILILFLLDNLLGFSFYYSNNQKISQLMNIEELKKKCSDNSDVLKSLNETEKDILERKNVINSFFELFSKENLDVKKLEPQVHIDTIYIEKTDTIIRDTINTHYQIKESSSKSKETVVISRSRLWHTLTSSYLFILLLILLPIVPFTEKTFSWSTMIGMIFLMIIVAGLIWLNQFLLGLIPIILNRVWINYVINILIQGIIFTIVAIWINAKPKT